MADEPNDARYDAPPPIVKTEPVKTEYVTIRERSRATGCLASLALLLLLAIGAFWFLLHSTASIAERAITRLTGRPLVVVSAPTVAERVQKLSRLETVVYSLDTVVEGNESSAVLPDMLAGDRLLMIIHGQTIAGVDLGQLKPDSVEISEGPGGRSVRLTLPPSQVFLTTVDNAKSRVYQRDTGLLVRADPNLETQVRNTAQGQLQQAALQDGILDAASKNARVEVTALLQGLGFAHVDVR